MARTNLNIAMDADLAIALKQMALASGRHQNAVIEDALKIVLDPMATLKTASETVQVLLAVLEAFEQRQSSIEDQIRVLADFVADAVRASATEDERWGR